jgi:hypothetical protein
MQGYAGSTLSPLVLQISVGAPPMFGAQFQGLFAPQSQIESPTGKLQKVLFLMSFASGARICRAEDGSIETVPIRAGIGIILAISPRP